MPRVAERFDAEALQQARSDKGWSRVALAELASCGVRQIAAYEGGQVPDPARLATLAGLLDVPPRQLIGPAPHSVSELRRAAGLTAEQVAFHLGMSRTTYRRLERDGIRNHSDPKFFEGLSRLFKVDTYELVLAIAQNPNRIDHVQRADAILRELAEAAASPEGQYFIERGDERLKIIAAALGYPVDTVRPALIAELRQIRWMAERVVATEAIAAWRGTEETGKWDNSQLEYRIKAIRSSISQALTGLLSLAEWTALVKIRRHAPVLAEELPHTTVQSLVQSGFVLAVLLRPDGVTASGNPPPLNVMYGLSPAGQSYYARNFLRHRSIHPQIQVEPPGR